MSGWWFWTWRRWRCRLGGHGWRTGGQALGGDWQFCPACGSTRPSPAASSPAPSPETEGGEK